MAMDVSKKKALVYDRGLYTYFAQALGERFEKVYYYVPDSAPYECSQLAEIGKGLPEIQRVDKFFSYLDKVDLIVFPDVYNYDDQKWLRSKGYRVFGSADPIELDKIGFLEILEEVGLPVPYSEVVDGTGELVSFFKGKQAGGWFIKSINRGDFDTKRFDGNKQLQNWIDQDLRPRVGKRSETMPMLVQKKIQSEAEAGYDGLCLDGECTVNSLAGYEDKDKRIVSMVQPETPEILGRINKAFAPKHKELGIRGHFSTEIRITKEGKPYFIDPTERIPSPPGGIFPKIYKNYPEAVYEIADGSLPVLKPVAKYGVEIILTSPFNECHEICVEFPKEHADNIVMKNHFRRDGEYYVVPNRNSGFWGSVVTWGNNWKKVADDAREIAKTVICEGLECDTSPFDNVQEIIEAGETHGIPFN